MSATEIMDRLLRECMTPQQLQNNRKCPYGGGCKDCPCQGKCPFQK